MAYSHFQWYHLLVALVSILLPNHTSCLCLPVAHKPRPVPLLYKTNMEENRARAVALGDWLLAPPGRIPVRPSNYRQRSRDYGAPNSCRRKRTRKQTGVGAKTASDLRPVPDRDRRRCGWLGSCYAGLGREGPLSLCHTGVSIRAETYLVWLQSDIDRGLLISRVDKNTRTQDYFAFPSLRRSQAARGNSLRRPSGLAGQHTAIRPLGKAC